MKNFVFWDIMPCSPLKVDRCYGGTSRLHLQGRRISQARNKLEVGALLASCFKLVSFLAYSSTLKVEATFFSETSVEFQHMTLRYIPE
jgi:hypothetical protein